jgi:hypothetical protein
LTYQSCCDFLSGADGVSDAQHLSMPQSSACGCVM